MKTVRSASRVGRSRRTAGRLDLVLAAKVIDVVAKVAVGAIAAKAAVAFLKVGHFLIFLGVDFVHESHLFHLRIGQDRPTREAVVPWPPQCSRLGGCLHRVPDAGDKRHDRGEKCETQCQFHRPLRCCTAGVTVSSPQK